MKRYPKYNYEEARMRLLNHLSEEELIPENLNNVFAGYCDESDIGYEASVTAVMVKIGWSGEFVDRQMAANCYKAVYSELNELFNMPNRLKFFSQYDYVYAYFNNINSEQDYELFERVCYISNLQQVFMQMFEDAGYPTPILSVYISKDISLITPIKDFKHPDELDFIVDDDITLKLDDMNEVMTKMNDEDEDTFYAMMCDQNFFNSIQKEVIKNDGMSLINAFGMVTNEELDFITYTFNIAYLNFYAYVANNYYQPRNYDPKLDTKKIDVNALIAYADDEDNDGNDEDEDDKDDFEDPDLNSPIKA